MSKAIDERIEELLQAARAALLTGNLAEAASLYRSALDLDATHAQANYWLGVLALKAGAAADAVVHLERASTGEPNNPDFRIDLALAYSSAGEPERAETSLQTARELAPNYAAAQLELCARFQSESNLEEAVEACERGLLVFPDHLELLRNKADLSMRLRRWLPALKVWQRILELRPDSAAVYFDFAEDCYVIGDMELAAQGFEKALELQPDFVAALLNLGLVQQRLGKLDTALNCFERALALGPDSPQVYKGLGDVLRKQEKLPQAIAAWRKATELQPNYAEAWQNLGLALEYQNQFEEALACHERVAQLRPDDATAHRYLGMILQDLGDLDRAAQEFSQALALAPQDAEAHWAVFALKAARGEFPEAWTEYEWRWHVKHRTTPNRSYPQPRWDGRPLDGRTILLWAEQGFGDAIQVARYFRLVQNCGGKVLVWCQRELEALFTTAAGGIDVFSHRHEPTHFDVHLPLMSLPFVFRTTLRTIPAAVPYLRAPSTATIRLPSNTDGRPRVGLVWCGSRSQPNDRRPVPFPAFQSLLDLPGLAFVSLQTGPAAADLREYPDRDRVTDLCEELTDFARTASVIEQLDLVITIDTSVAHLAGALGKPVWTLLSVSPDWRWMRERQDSPWYPTMRLFRQTRPGDWSDVIERVRTELELWLNAKLDPSGWKPLLAEGMRRHQAGELEQAELCYRRVLDVDARQRDACHFLGVLKRCNGELAAAKHFLEQALASGEAPASLHHDLGLLWSELGQWNEAIAAYRTAIQLQPHFADAFYNLGNAYYATKQTRGAEDAYRAALHHQPQLAEAHYNLGLLAQERGDLPGALREYQKVIELRPDHRDALLNLALALKDSGDPHGAERRLQQLLAIDPGNAKAQVNLAGTLVTYHLKGLRGTDALQEARSLCEQVIAKDATLAGAWANLGVVQQLTGDVASALQSLERALDLLPDNAETRFNLAIAQLLAGQFEAGWRNYEARWQTRNAIFATRSFPQPRWAWSASSQADLTSKRESPLAGVTLLAHAEQGLGDAIQFVRYVPLLAELGARVVVECPAPLRRLFSTVQGAAQVVSRGEPIPTCQFQVPMMSLPLEFGTTEATIPRNVPYLRAPSLRRVSLPAKTLHDVNVGLAWKGSSEHAADRLRSLPAECLMPLLDQNSVHAFGLQVGASPEEIERLSRSGRFTDVAGQLHDFADTAALIEQLDLVISVDTAVAHLAGALGKPVWILLPFAPDWRWLLDREDSPWYPTARLFRQTSTGDWAPVIHRVAEALRRLS